MSIVAGDEERAVKAVLDQSFDALAETGRRALSLLGFVPGTDFTAELLAVLCEGSPLTAVAILEASPPPTWWSRCRRTVTPSMIW
ncbi:putative methyltransferase [Hamadaea flava]|uniref:Uncharacterized protein n=1 Tax=Hamadaea flava TaxID=1742688 RepID=A0ABV8LMU0_9ACTN|nr:hypothetical protein [Hamadaea flava]MCP2323532.1 putative methyltransferase [Hamadaea flava]